MRRLAVAKQRLAGATPAGDADGLLALVRELGCVQLDPTSAVARSHLLVLWSRLGAFDIEVLEALRWRERRLFEYWAHAASLVPSDDFRLHEATLMRVFAQGDALWARRLREWMQANARLRRAILRELRARGPLRARDFDSSLVAKPWLSTGWTNERNVHRLLDAMWGAGEVLVAGRAGNERLWDLPERCVAPDALAAPRLRREEAVRLAAERSLRSLGVATAKQIGNNFIRGRYAGLASALRRLEHAGRIVAVETDWPGSWLVHADDVPLLERLADGEWEPRTTLLSPFDNLICDRERTRLIFGFDYTIEIYVPKAKRRYGYFVMPVLDGDRLIARIDPRYDRSAYVLEVNAVHPEADAAPDRALGEALDGLRAFLGAQAIRCGDGVPPAWRRALAA
ncbi:MAG: YcaQ family DNA glycosylase [Thermoleophilia bacterium]|nr:YcaQ family DNA glycosylase [Thermoleophilia bacterium]